MCCSNDSLKDQTLCGFRSSLSKPRRIIRNQTAKTQADSSVEFYYQLLSELDIKQEMLRRDVFRSLATSGTTLRNDGESRTRASSGTHQDLQLLLRNRSCTSFIVKSPKKVSTFDDISRVYEIGKEIGGGSSGIIKLARRKSHPKKKFSVKIVCKDDMC